MLDMTMATRFLPGTNRQGDAAGANWTYLLPSLDLRRILCLGSPPTSTLRTLSRRAGRVIVATRCKAAMQKVAKEADQWGLGNVATSLAPNRDAFPYPSAHFDLVTVVDPVACRRLRGDGRFRAELRRLLAPAGLLYFELGRWNDRWFCAPLSQDIGNAFGAAMPFWITPMIGQQMQSAVPAHDRRSIAYFRRHALVVPSNHRRSLQWVERLVTAHSPLGRFDRRRGVLLGRDADNLATDPPEYLCALAQESGVDLRRHRWAMSAPGKYPSRKVIFFLFERFSPSPRYVVKLTREPELNDRLENEYRALCLLQDVSFGDRSTVPAAAFFGHHGGLAVLGETAVAGVAPDNRAISRRDATLARTVVERLTRLAELTLQRSVVTAETVAVSLQSLLDRFLVLYDTTAAQRKLLERQINLVAQSPESVPLVFQHGDPGIWNVLVTPGGEVALLDWEAAEPQGMPLWDLFYFLRSYGVRAARQRGVFNPLKACQRCFFNDSGFGSLLIESVTQYCQRTGLAEDLVEPLFYTCWMHRALKEAMRLPAAELHKGHFAGLLKLCLDRRDGLAILRPALNPTQGGYTP